MKGGMKRGVRWSVRSEAKRQDNAQGGKTENDKNKETARQGHDYRSKTRKPQEAERSSFLRTGVAESTSFWFSRRSQPLFEQSDFELERWIWLMRRVDKNYGQNIFQYTDLLIWNGFEVQKACAMTEGWMTPRGKFVFVERLKVSFGICIIGRILFLLNTISMMY